MLRCFVCNTLLLQAALSTAEYSVNNLLVKLSISGVGCFIGKTFVAAFAYADDSACHPECVCYA